MPRVTRRAKRPNDYGRVVVKNPDTGFAVFYPLAGVARRVSTAAQVRELARRGEISEENLAEVELLLPDGEERGADK